MQNDEEGVWLTPSRPYLICIKFFGEFPPLPFPFGWVYVDMFYLPQRE